MFPARQSLRKNPELWSFLNSLRRLIIAGTCALSQLTLKTGPDEE
jgi:hypothetical protein